MMACKGLQRSVACGKAFGEEDVMAISQRKKRRIIKRDGLCCRYCGIATVRARYKHDRQPLVTTFDHFVPKALGGTDDDSNIVVACLSCNQEKGHQHPEVFMLGLRIRAFGDMINEAHLFPNPHYDRAKATFDRLAA
jgi:hypothetical protein